MIDGTKHKAREIEGLAALADYNAPESNPIVWKGEAIYDSDARLLYIPVAFANGQMGYCTRGVDGMRGGGFVYLNPSTGSDDATPTVFIYQGTGDPGVDGAECHIVIETMADEPAPNYVYDGKGTRAIDNR